jgi:hypothetical protein
LNSTTAGMEAARSIDETPPTIRNLTYASAVLSLLAYICSGHDVERRPEYPYNIVLIPFLCTMVHHYLLLTASQRPRKLADSKALTIKNIFSTAVLSGFWFVFMRIHISMSRVSGKTDTVVPTMALAKSFGTAESIVLAAITWEAIRFRFL